MRPLLVLLVLQVGSLALHARTRGIDVRKSQTQTSMGSGGFSVVGNHSHSYTGPVTSNLCLNQSTSLPVGPRVLISNGQGEEAEVQL